MWESMRIWEKIIIIKKNEKKNEMKWQRYVSGLFMSLLLAWHSCLLSRPPSFAFSVCCIFPLLSVNSDQVKQTCQSTVIWDISLLLCFARLSRAERMQSGHFTVFGDYLMPLCLFHVSRLWGDIVSINTNDVNIIWNLSCWYQKVWSVGGTLSAKLELEKRSWITG